MRLLRFTRLVRLSLAGMRLRVSFPVARVFCFVTNSLVATWRMSAGVTTPRVIVEAMDGGTLVAEMKIGLGVQVQVAVGRDEVPDVGFGWTRLRETVVLGAMRIGAGRMKVRRRQVAGAQGYHMVEGMVLVVFRVILGNYLEGWVHGFMKGILGLHVMVKSM
jgi:hypothetical protein